MRRSYTLFFLLMLFSAPLFAGVIKGKITDSKDGSPLRDVLVTVQGGGAATETDTAGEFILKDMPDGKYTLQFAVTSFKDATATVTVAGDAPAIANVSMKGDSHQLAGNVVRATRVTRTESAVVLEIKKSSVAVSGISAAQISKTQDRNAADVVKRIPGVTIQDDRFITVRGLADRYNTVWLNDAGAPSSEVDKKAFSFDLIPSGLIDRILIFKTPAADLPGDIAGGAIKIYTASMPSKTEYNINIQGSYRQGSTGTAFNAEPRHSGDVFGYDNGSRNLPSAVPGTEALQTDPNIDMKAITKSFGNDWKYSSKNASPDLRLSGSAANLFNLGSVKLGNVAGISYTHTKTNYDVQRYDFTDTTEDNHFNDKESADKVNLALMENISAVIGNSKIEFRNLYNQIGTSVITERTSVIDRPGLNNYKAYQLNYENRRTYAGQLSGSHHNDKDTRRYNWTLGYSSIDRNQPDLRRLWYLQDQNSGNFYAQVTAYGDVNLGGGRIYSKLNEQVYSFSHQFTQKFKVWGDNMLDLNLGNYIEYKNRVFDMRSLAYVITPGQQAQELKQLPIDQIFAETNLGDQNLFRVNDQTELRDHYEATNKLIASFVSVNVPITARFKALLGLRYENNSQDVIGHRSQELVDTNFKTDFLLPSVNLTYNFTAKTLVRLAYGKTVSRPEFREQAPLYSYDFALNSGLYGALFSDNALKVAEIQNLDARWEFYPSAGELIHAGVFYKSFKNPIQRVFYGGTANGEITIINGTKAYVAGLEVDVRKNLMVLDDMFGTRFLKNFVFVGNLALSKSELRVDSADAISQGARPIDKGPFEGQSNFVINGGFFYQNDSLGILGSVLYNYYSPRVYALGYSYNGLGQGSIGDRGFHSLDISLSKVLAKRFTVSLSVQNLLDQEFRFVQDQNFNNKFESANGDVPYRSWKPGRYFTLGLKVRL